MPRPATGSTNNVAADGSSWLAIEVVEWRPAWMLYPAGARCMPFFGALSTAWNHVCSQVAHRQIQMGLCARADRLDRGPGRARVYWTRARAKGHECGTLIDTPEVQRAMVEAAASRAASDSDHRGPEQLAVEYRQHALPVFLVEGAQSVIQKNPARPVQ
jgi:hypothetical protein